MVCQYLEDLFELYLLGAGSPGDARTISEHLRSGCPTCLARLREAALAVYFLCLSPKPGALDPKLKKALLLRISKEHLGRPAR